MYGSPSASAARTSRRRTSIASPRASASPFPNTELWIVDENDRRVGPNTVGQLVIRGATVMKGYWEKPESTRRRSCARDPLPGEQVLYTGDFCRMDDEGYLYFVGRMDDIIKIARREGGAQGGGERAHEHPSAGVEGSRRHRGAPTRSSGQAVKAFVVLDPDVTTHRRTRSMRECQGRLESFMVPKTVVILADLPKTTTGKIKKTGLA